MRIGGTNDWDARSTEVMPSNAWSHVVATYEKNEGVLRIWVDGIQKDAREVTGNVNVSGNSFYIGGNNFWGEVLRWADRQCPSLQPGAWYRRDPNESGDAG